MPSFSDSIFLFVLALLIVGPKKLPVLARELGKWVGEFRRASNEFKMQMEEELRLSEQADRLKKLEAMEAAAPVAPALPGESATAEVVVAAGDEAPHTVESVETATGSVGAEDEVKPLPIAGMGEVSIMPPATGLPTPRKSALSGLIGSIPKVESQGVPPVSTTESKAREAELHGD